MPTRLLFPSVCLLVLLLPAPALRAAEPDAASAEFFEKKIRPLLQNQCRECHSAATKQRGGLKLDSRATLLQGGDSGPAVTPGDPDKSLLIKAVRYTDEPRMPKKGKLSDEQIADLTAWVKMGAPWPESGPVATGPKPFDLAERRKQVAGTLSGGEQQMLAIGRALMSRPKLILFDEPSLGLAPNIVERVFEIIAEIRAGGATVLMVEQNAYAALEMCDYAYLLESGVIATSGKGAELIGNPHVQAAYLGG